MREAGEESVVILWCHASPHDTNTLLLLYMVSTAESRHHKDIKIVKIRA
nr:hypothetical protein [bacterium]